MEKIIHNVAEINDADRRALEHLIGAHLAEHQQVIIRVVNLDLTEEPDPIGSGDAPPWSHIYDGLPEHEIDRLDQSIRERASLARDSD